jgi:hypothetical protein
MYSSNAYRLNSYGTFEAVEMTPAMWSLIVRKAVMAFYEVVVVPAQFGQKDYVVALAFNAQANRPEITLVKSHSKGEHKRLPNIAA